LGLKELWVVQSLLLALLWGRILQRVGGKRAQGTAVPSVLFFLSSHFTCFGLAECQ